MQCGGVAQTAEAARHRHRHRRHRPTDRPTDLLTYPTSASPSLGDRLWFVPGDFLFLSWLSERGVRPASQPQPPRGQTGDR